MNDPSYVVIVGATSAIARGIASGLARRGFGLILAARDDVETDAIARDCRLTFGVATHSLHWDAEDEEDGSELVDSCMEIAGDSLSGFVYCAGYMEDQARAQEESAVARATVEVNLLAAMLVLERVAKVFEARKRGFIVGVSSVAGDRGRQSNYIYGAAKAGFSAYLQGLRNRLHKSNVSVTTVKPGFVDSKMTWGVVGSPLVASPEAVGERIAKSALAGRNTVYVPFFWWIILFVIRAIPEPVFKRLSL